MADAIPECEGHGRNCVASPCACAGRAEQRNQTKWYILMQVLRRVVWAEALAALRAAPRRAA